ncbi:MAG: SDR family oxidoreductase [Bacteroidota bacterium]
MELEIRDKVFIVSGGASGIGEAIVRGIAAEGGIPIIVEKNGERAVALCQELNQKGSPCLAIEKELNQAEGCQEVVEQVVAQISRIDGLINNAGVNDGISLENGSPGEWMQSLDRNLHHYFFLAHFALPYLKQTRGSIVNISSKTALTGQGGTSAYAAAKGAILALTREWAVELLSYQIRVNAIVPSEVFTPMYEQWINSFPEPRKKLEDIQHQIPLEKRMTKPTEIADMVLFLLSERAAHITGQHLFVDGGYVHLDRSLNTLH